MDPKGTVGRIYKEDHYIQSNLDNSNADFSKLPDFSKTSDGPEMFLYCLLLKYYRFFESYYTV